MRRINPHICTHFKKDKRQDKGEAKVGQRGGKSGTKGRQKWDKGEAKVGQDNNKRKVRDFFFF